jgi:hypothetical protein
MGSTIDFFYGIGRRYSYLAASQMDRLEEDTGVSVRWRPLYSTELMKRRGVDPFGGPPPSGQYEPDYRTRDVSRWAQLYGIPFHDAPSIGGATHSPPWRQTDWAGSSSSASVSTTLCLARALRRPTLPVWLALQTRSASTARNSFAWSMTRKPRGITNGRLSMRCLPIFSACRVSSLMGRCSGATTA